MYKDCYSHIKVKFFYTYKDNHTEKYSISDGSLFGCNDWLHHNKFRKNEDVYSQLTKKPNFEVDTKLLVCKDKFGKFNSDKEVKKRHFSHFDEHDGVWCFGAGCSSFTTSGLLEHYSFWELVKS